MKQACTYIYRTLRREDVICLIDFEYNHTSPPFMYDSFVVPNVIISALLIMSHLSTWIYELLFLFMSGLCLSRMKVLIFHFWINWKNTLDMLSAFSSEYWSSTRIILCVHPADERGRYVVSHWLGACTDWSFISLRPGNTCMHRWNWSCLAYIMACCLLGAMLLPETTFQPFVN